MKLNKFTFVIIRMQKLLFSLCSCFLLILHGVKSQSPWSRTCPLSQTKEVPIVMTTDGQIFLKDDFEGDLDTDVVAEKLMKRCPCTDHFYCTFGDVCRRDRDRFMTEDGLLGANCFKNDPGIQEYGEVVLPWGCLWIAFVFSLFFFTEFGVSVRSHVKYKIIFPVVLKVVPTSSENNYIQRFRVFLTVNKKVEEEIDKRMELLRIQNDRQQFLSRWIEFEMESGNSVDPRTRGLLTGDVNAKLLLKTKKYECTSVSDDPLSNSVDKAENAESCSICLGPFENGDCVGDIPCKHVFHKTCLKDWLRRKNSCPLCQGNIGRAKFTRKKRDATSETN